MVKKFGEKQPGAMKKAKLADGRARRDDGTYGNPGYSKSCDLYVLNAVEYVLLWAKHKHLLACNGR